MPSQQKENQARVSKEYGQIMPKKQNAHRHIKAIVFDFGGVLLDWNLYYLYRKIFDDDQAIERFLKEVRLREINVEMDHGTVDPAVLETMCVRYPQYAQPIRAFDQRWIETIRGPIQPTVEILKQIKQSGMALYALSNFSANKFAVIRKHYDFFGWFDQIVISGEEGITKPDRRIFHRLLKRTGRRPDECLLIDDTPVNIEAASQLGFETILFRSPEQLGSELRQRGLLV